MLAVLIQQQLIYICCPANSLGWVFGIFLERLAY